MPTRYSPEFWYFGGNPGFGIGIPPPATYVVAERRNLKPEWHQLAPCRGGMPNSFPIGSKNGRNPVKSGRLRWTGAAEIPSNPGHSAQRSPGGDSEDLEEEIDMRPVGPLARALAVAGLMLSALLAQAPALAGTAEVELLQSYIGSWKGRGIVTGAEQETVICRMTIDKGNQDKVNYRGRCAMAGTTVSVNGTLAYIDASRRYEAAMTTNAGFSGIAVGQSTGGGVVFNLRERVADEDGKPLTVTAAITLTGARIMVDFSVVFNETGQSLAAKVPFTK